MFARLIVFCSLLTCLTAAPLGAPLAAEPRSALVIGNAGYSFGPLANPTHDATDMAAALRGAGFEVLLKTDATQRDMVDSIRTFGDMLKRKGGVGLFFFSGHGVQANGENYIVPLDAVGTGDSEFKRSAVSAGEVVDAMAAARNGLNMIVLDACRTNPFTHTTQGLSRIDTNASLFVSYATSPGSVALDGTGRNSPYTENLVRAIGVSDIPLEETFKRTLKGVYQETHGRQTPWISSSFFGDFYFMPGRAGAAGQPQIAASPTASAATRTPALTGIYRDEGRNPDGSRYTGMLAINQNGDRFRFKWWIGSNTYSGTGQLAGKMLVVNWGDKTPVVYTFASGGRLDGDWADGSAKDTLNLFARASDDAASPGGRYRVNGRNPDGTPYRGVLTMTSQSNRYSLEWRVDSSTYKGTGTLDGNLLTVNWGGDTPLVYALAADGTLKGLWDAGDGEETLTPDR
jgi:uncharacterized caspase-like protein